MQLRNHHALGPVDHESPLRSHERNFAHVHFLFLSPPLFFERESHIERRGKRLALAHALAHRHFRLADLVRVKLQHDFFVVTGDWEDLRKNGVQTSGLAAT